MLSVVDKGAIPNDYQDDRQAFQDAIDEVDAAGGGDVYVPPGLWFIQDQALVLHRGVNLLGPTHGGSRCHIVGTGDPHTVIDCGDYWTGRIESLAISAQGGHGIDYNLTNNARFTDLFVTTNSNDHWAFYGFENTFDCVMTNVRCPGAGGWNGNGLMLAAHTYVFGFSASGCNEAIRFTSPSAPSFVAGFRIEVNRIGVRAGWDKDGNASYCTLSLRDGSFESNGTAIIARGTQNLSNIHSWSNALGYPYSETERGGFIFEGCQGSNFIDVSANSNLDRPTITLGDTRKSVFQNTNAYSNGAPAWDMQYPQAELNTFLYSNFGEGS